MPMSFYKFRGGNGRTLLFRGNSGTPCCTYALDEIIENPVTVLHVSVIGGLFSHRVQVTDATSSRGNFGASLSMAVLPSGTVLLSIGAPNQRVNGLNSVGMVRTPR